jgi:GTP pyrophosphokinase
MATVTRVLPWRRHVAPPVEEVASLVSTFRSRHPKTSAASITDAYEVAKRAHSTQVRRSGEAYITHPLAVASIVAELGLDDTTIAAALLHDAVEDTELTLEDVDSQFGTAVATIVDGVTKLDRIRFDSKEAQQAATMRKMLVAMAKDVRVLIIKLADRLHNMRTVAGLPSWKQERTARETLDIYAPLAHRLGMQEMKQQLEDLAFAALYPKRYAEIDHMIATRAPERDLYLTQVLEEVRHRLDELRIEADVTGRPKHLWSIYEKMVVKGKEFGDIFDLVGIRVTVESVKDCYAALGSIHSTWSPVQGRFKDYIAMPKFNLYQSLHTTVVGPAGKTVEVQIRTREMHQRAEFGVAAHWAYKGDGEQSDMPWLSRIIDWQQETQDPDAFMRTLKVDLEQDEVYVFTPKGRVLTLAAGATPIDFAYAIHTEVGHACIGARVNGRLVPLDTKLHSGDTVEIFTSKVEGAGPSRDWLKLVATPRAANKIRQWFSRERREDAMENGREDLIKALRREGLPVQKLTRDQVIVDVAKTLNYADVDALHAAIGEGHVSAKSVASRIARTLKGGDDGEAEVQMPTTAHRTTERDRKRRGSVGVHVEGLDDLMVRLSRCCTPVPGDEIIGFVTRGRGVSVHRADCANAVSLAQGTSERLIEVEWDSDISDGSFVAAIEVKALDRARLLSDVARVLSDHHVNILSSTSQTGTDRISKMQFEFELGDPSHLDAVIGQIKRIESVYDAYRVLPGKGG